MIRAGCWLVLVLVGAEAEFGGTERFEIIDRLGAGGMGVVYEATDRETNAKIALKTLRNVSAAALMRFKNEFRALQDLQHTNLVSLGELIESDGQWFITMELVRGTDILQFIRTPDMSPETDIAHRVTVDGSARGFDLDRLKSAMQQLASALLELHDANLVHRDVKPSNIRVTPEGRVVLLDFGLIADTDEMQRDEDASVVGTAAYMAPEQGAGRPVGPAADWYSFGVVLYEALTGLIPFDGSPLEVVLNKQQKEPIAPGARAVDVPTGLDGLCMELLRFDPDARPSGHEVLRRLGARLERSASVTRTSQFSERGRFVGRAVELASLEESFVDVDHGAPVCVSVTGQSGFGKTALVKHFVTELAAADDTVMTMWGRCYERESVPFKAFDGVIDALAKEMLRMPKERAAELVPANAALLPRVFPVLSRVEVIAMAPQPVREPRDPLELRSRAFAALRQLLALLCERRKVIVVIDDLQWADADSMHLMSELLQPPDPPLLLLLATTRDAGGDLGRLPCDVRSIEVGPLDLEDARRLARRLLGRTDAQSISAAHLAVEAQGHPMYIEEIVHHSLTEGSELETFRLDTAIWNRIQQLPTEARAILELVAIAGVPLPHETIQRASEVPASVFTRQVSLLRVANLARSSGKTGSMTIEPYHDRVREAVQANIDDDARQERHARLAVGLELSRSPDLETVAIHLHGSGNLAGAQAAYERAAEHAAAGLAFERAARLYRSALELLPDGDEHRYELYRSYGDVLSNAGRGPEAAAAYVEALPGATPSNRIELQRMASAQLLACGHIDEGLELIETFLASVGLTMAPSPGRALMRFLGLRLRVRMRGYGFTEREDRELPGSKLTRIDVAEAVARSLGMVIPMQAACFQARGLLLALSAGEPRRIATALLSEAVYASISGHRATRHIERALSAATEIVQRHPDPGLRASLLGAKAVIAFQMGRWRECHENAVKAEQIFLDECAGYRWELSTMRIFQGFALATMGRVGDAMKRLPELIRDAIDRGDFYAATTLQCSIGFYEPLVRDDPVDARRVLAEALDRWSPSGYHIQHANALRNGMTISLYEGDYQRAFEDCEREWAQLKRSFILRTQLMFAIFWDTRGRAALAHAMRSGDDKAMRVARQAANKLDGEKVEYIRAYGVMLRAGLAYNDGDTKSALAYLEDAERLAVTTDLGLARFSSAYARGRIIGGSEGAALAAEALEWARGEGLRNPRRAAHIWVPWIDARD